MTRDESPKTQRQLIRRSVDARLKWFAIFFFPHQFITQAEQSVKTLSLWPSCGGLEIQIEVQPKVLIVSPPLHFLHAHSSMHSYYYVTKAYFHTRAEIQTICIPSISWTFFQNYFRRHNMKTLRPNQNPYLRPTI